MTQATLVLLILGATVALFASDRPRADHQQRIAASTAFATSVASPVNALVLGPGGYRFGDFLKAGIALQALVLALAAALILLFHAS